MQRRIEERESTRTATAPATPAPVASVTPVASGELPALVVVPPPTPNGGLHVGHLSGPYLYADVYRRSLARRGAPSSLAFHTDVHQSYVARAARAKGVAPEILAEDASAEIREALSLADIDVTLHGNTQNGYATFVHRFFAPLLRSEAVARRDIAYPADASGRPLAEAWVSGHCPTCLASTCGGICEVCGHPNAPADLIATSPLGPADQADGQSRPLEVGRTVTVPTLVFRLEPFRAALAAHFAPLLGRLRPALRHLLESLLAKDLPEIPLTLPSGWGCRCDVLGDGQVYNPWLELLPAHLYFAERTAHPWTAASAPILFFGFDNSFFYTLVHGALLLARGDYALPRHYVTNEFYELGDTKFSTSLGNAVWAQDALRTHTPDALRYFLARTNPAFQRSSFEEARVAPTVERELHGPLRALIALRATLAPGVAADERATLARFSPYLERLESLYAPEVFDLRALAVALVGALPALSRLAEQGLVTRRGLDGVLVRWASLASPIVPRTGKAILAMVASGEPGGLPPGPGKTGGLPPGPGKTAAEASRLAAAAVSAALVGKEPS